MSPLDLGLLTLPVPTFFDEPQLLENYLTLFPTLSALAQQLGFTQDRPKSQNSSYLTGRFLLP